MRIEDSACAVTGASSGIGEATARLLASRGARVALLARRSDRLAALAAQPPGSVPLVTDVTDDVQLRAALARVGDVLGRIDVLVNDAGQGLHVPLEQLDPGDLRAVFDLNVVVPLVAIRAVLPGMRERGAGAIVNVSSLTSLRAFARLGGYAVTKAALNVLSRVTRGVRGCGDCGVAGLPGGHRHRVPRPPACGPLRESRRAGARGPAGVGGRSRGLRD